MICYNNDPHGCADFRQDPDFGFVVSNVLDTHCEAALLAAGVFAGYHAKKWYVSHCRAAFSFQCPEKLQSS